MYVWRGRVLLSKLGMGELMQSFQSTRGNQLVAPWQRRGADRPPLPARGSYWPVGSPPRGVTEGNLSQSRNFRAREDPGAPSRPWVHRESFSARECLTELEGRSRL